MKGRICGRYIQCSKSNTNRLKEMLIKFDKSGLASEEGKGL